MLGDRLGDPELVVAPPRSQHKSGLCAQRWCQNSSSKVRKQPGRPRLTEKQGSSPATAEEPARLHTGQMVV